MGSPEPGAGSRVKMHWVVENVTGSSWTYAVIVLAVALDGVCPLVPGEVTTITAGVLAADGDLSVIFVFAAAFAGATIGDNATYWLGRGLGARAARRLFRSQKARDYLDRADRQLKRRGPLIIVASRFLPGGRTATTFASGTLHMEWRRFLTADIVASALWAAYATALGYFGGSTFQHSVWKPLALSIGLGLIFGIAGDIGRRFARGAKTARS